MVDVKITYETLFDLLRREKGRNELQALDSSFYSDVMTYLKDKQKILTGQDTSSSLYSRGEHEKIKIQIKNIKKILTELYELREKKILNLAVNKVKTGSELIDTSNLLVEEKRFFSEACIFLEKYRTGVLEQILSLDFPSKEFNDFVSNASRVEEKKEEVKIEEKDYAESLPVVASKSENLKVRLTCDLPKFIGTDKGIYGPFKKDEEAELPSAVAELLMKKGRATSI